MDCMRSYSIASGQSEVYPFNEACMLPTKSLSEQINSLATLQNLYDSKPYQVAQSSFIETTKELADGMQAKIYLAVD